MILNLTQHHGTHEQGVIEPRDKREVQQLLTFNQIPTSDEMASRAALLALIALSHRVDSALIGGAPYFMSTLEKALCNVGIPPVYSFSQRICVERTEGNTVIKENVFKHIGYISGVENHAYINGH